MGGHTRHCRQADTWEEIGWKKERGRKKWRREKREERERERGRCWGRQRRKWAFTPRTVGWVEGKGRGRAGEITFLPLEGVKTRLL